MLIIYSTININERINNFQQISLILQFLIFFESFPKKLIQESEWTQAPEQSWKKIAEMLILLIFFILLLISAIFLIFTANKFWLFIFAIAFLCIFNYLEDLSP